MKTEAGGHRRPIRLDSVAEVPGGVVGTDPYRRWGPTFRWVVFVLEVPLRFGPNWRPFNKRDVVVTDLSRTEELYREGPFTARAANNRQSVLVTTIKSDGLDHFLRRMQIEQSTIGPVSAPSGKVSGLQQARASLRLWQESLGGGSKRSRNREQGDRED